MIPLIEKEIVDNHGWLTKDEFWISSRCGAGLPGVFAVNISVAVGINSEVVQEALIAALGTILPSFLMILTIAIFLTPGAYKDQ